jgi:hypothetical protein
MQAFAGGDGLDYASECFAACAGVEVITSGPCAPGEGLLLATSDGPERQSTTTLASGLLEDGVSSTASSERISHAAMSRFSVDGFK